MSSIELCISLAVNDCKNDVICGYVAGVHDPPQKKNPRKLLCHHQSQSSTSGTFVQVKSDFGL